MNLIIKFKSLITKALKVFGNAEITGDLTVDTDTLYVDSADSRVGIGTTNPTSTLHVVGNSLLGGSVTTTSNLLVGGPVIYLNNQQTLTVGVNNLTLGNAAAWSTITYGHASATNHYFVAGNVGIGTDSPSEKLTVSGNISASGSLSAASANITGDLTVDTNTLYVDSADSRVGIGTTSPSVKLDIGGHLTSSPVGVPSVYISDDVNNVAGVLMGNANTGGTADFRFLIKDTTDHYLAFAQPSVGNVIAPIFGLARNSSDFIFNNGGTPRNLAIGTNNETHLIFGTNNAERMRIASDGDVGIGTTNPTTNLHVVGKNATGNTDFIALFIENGVTPEGGAIIGTAADRAVMVQGNGGAFYLGRDVTNNIEFAMGTSVLGEAFVASSTSHKLALRTNNIRALTIDTSQNIGIGTDSPSAKLHVAGDTLITGDLTVDTDTLYVDSADSRVGIGTTSPDYALDVIGDIRASSDIIVTNGRSFAGTGSDGSIRVIMEVDESDQVNVGAANSAYTTRFRTGGGNPLLILNGTSTEIARFDGSGNLGIGTDTPSAKLHVAGDTQVDGHFSATTKSFLIDNPNGGKLQYGVVESNEHGVYVRGKTSDSTITLPEHWEWLVDTDSVTVQLTPVGKYQSLYVISQTHLSVEVGGVEGEYNYTIYGTRKDVEPLIVDI